MGPFDFLNNIKNNLEQYFQPTLNQVGNTISQMFPMSSNNFGTTAGSKGPDIHPIINAAAKMQAAQQPAVSQPQQATIPSPQNFQQGFSSFGASTPVATASPVFSQAASKLPPTVDPYLPAVIALMETGGGAKQVANNNPFNIQGIQGGQTQFINYPDLATAILGGNNNGVQSQGFLGTILNNPAYANFRSSGNLADFFSHFTPPGPGNGNPTLADLISRYQNLRALFPNAQ